LPPSSYCRGGQYLVLQVFRKDDYAVKYAVEPLLDGSLTRTIFRSGSTYLGWA
jgi:hypothetical protein